MQNLDDQQLFRKIQQGDQKLFKQLFEVKYNGLVKLAYHFVQDEAQAKDIVQQSFISFWEKKSNIQLQSSIQGYLRKMITNNALAFIRTNTRRKNIIEPMLNAQSQSEESPENQYLHTELQDNITNAIDDLPEQCALIFRMSRYEDMSYKEISAELNISPKTVENQIGKGLKRLRTTLKKYLNVISLIFIMDCVGVFVCS